MKNSVLTLMVACTVIFVSAASFAATYDATGKWNYSQSGLYNDCEDPNNPESGETILIQNGDSASLLMGGRTLSGSVNGSTYTFIDYFFEDGGYTSLTITFTLSPSTSGSGNFTWNWSDGFFSCAGGGQLSVDKHTQAQPVYDASGMWNYSITGHYNNCGDPNEQPEVGTFTVTQTGNRVTALDNHGDSYTGWVSGSTYVFVTTYPDDGGITSDVNTVTLTSNSSGSGSAVWYWNDIDWNCSGGYNILISRQQAANGLTPAVHFLLLNNE
jgi:hypothetical protein